MSPVGQGRGGHSHSQSVVSKRRPIFDAGTGSSLKTASVDHGHGQLETFETGLPFSLVSWPTPSLGFPRCSRASCAGVLPLALLWGKPGHLRESQVTFLLVAGQGVCVPGHPALAV